MAVGYAFRIHSSMVSLGILFIVEIFHLKFSVRTS